MTAPSCLHHPFFQKDRPLISEKDNFQASEISREILLLTEINSDCVLKNITTPLEAGWGGNKKSPQLLLCSLKSQRILVACHQLSSCNKWSLAANMGTVQPSNRPKIFLQGRKTCLNNEPCRAQADHKYFKFLLPLLVTQTPLVCHLMPGLGCVTCSSSSASVGS